MSPLSNETTGTKIHLINLNGPLNISQAKTIIQQFKDIAEQGFERVVVNLEDVRFIDSRGLLALVNGYKIFGNEANNFRLAAPQDQPRLLFELTGFDRIFQIFDTVDEAITPETSIKVQLPLNAPAFVLPLIPDLVA